MGPSGATSFRAEGDPEEGESPRGSLIRVLRGKTHAEGSQQSTRLGKLQPLLRPLSSAALSPSLLCRDLGYAPFRSQRTNSIRRGGCPVRRMPIRKMRPDSQMTSAVNAVRRINVPTTSNRGGSAATRLSMMNGV